MTIPTDLGPMHLSEPPRDTPSLIVQAEIEDLARELRAVRRKERWHFVWALTGISPAALLPAIGLFREEAFGLIVLLSFAVTISQFYLGVKASGKVNELRRSLEKLREEI